MSPVNESLGLQRERPGGPKPRQWHPAHIARREALSITEAADEFAHRAVTTSLLPSEY